MNTCLRWAHTTHIMTPYPLKCTIHTGHDSDRFSAITQLCKLGIASNFPMLFQREFAIHLYQNTDILYRWPMSFNMLSK